MYEDPSTVAAVILETIVGTNGLIVPPDGYLQSVRDVCDRHGILLILDEVMSGFGRSGKWFACDHWDVVPDILTTAKGINSGYVPLGTMTVSKAIADWLKTTKFPGGLTYAGHPLACATGVASIKAYKDGEHRHPRSRGRPGAHADAACTCRQASLDRRNPRQRPLHGGRAGQGPGRPARPWCPSTPRARTRRPCPR